MKDSITKTPAQVEQDNKMFTLVVLQRIGAYILQGLTEDEACVLSGYDPDMLKTAKENDKNIGLYLEKQRVQFKHEHLKIINDKKSDKNSMWLLEKTLPEFGNQKKSTQEATANIISAIIRDIQNDHGTANIVTVPSEDVTSKKGTVREAIVSVDAFLK